MKKAPSADPLSVLEANCRLLEILLHLIREERVCSSHLQRKEQVCVSLPQGVRTLGGCVDTMKIASLFVSQKIRYCWPNGGDCTCLPTVQAVMLLVRWPAARQSKRLAAYIISRRLLSLLK